MSNIVPIQGRPLTGVYPSCPPSPLIDCMAGLEQCYADVKRAQWFIKQIMIDIINCDPAIIGRGTPIIGVTDGTPAQPGIVGEFVFFTQSVPTPLGNTTQNVNAGVLQPGDWNVWAYVRFPTGAQYSTVNFYQIPSPPPGFNDSVDGGYIFGDSVTVISLLNVPAVQALISVPTLLAFSLTTIAAAAGSVTFNVAARRMR